MNFSDFNLHPSLLEGLSTMGFDKPTPIQEQAIPVIMSGKDLIACAQTGTGKTAAYLLPILSSLVSDSPNHVDTLVVVPTRELALQIERTLEGFSYFTPVSSLAIFGGADGSSFDREKKALTEGANIIIATPGRLLSHLNMGYVKFGGLKHFVLDEADRMLDMGFSEDIAKITRYIPKQRQTLMFSATMPPKIRQLASRSMHNPMQINIAVAKPAAGIKQEVYYLHDRSKNHLIVQLLKEHTLQSVLIFASTKEAVKTLERELHRLHINVQAIHSDLEQNVRKQVLLDFTNRKCQVLVATDILSRGIDIDGIDMVINYNVPRNAEDYVHRVGRTARAEREGVAITFVNEKERLTFKKIEDFLGKKITVGTTTPHSH